MRNDEIKPDVVTYNTLLNKAHTLDEGRAIIADMRNDGITPNAYPLLAQSRTSCCIYGFLKAITWVENYCIALKQSLVTCNSRHLSDVQDSTKQTVTAELVHRVITENFAFSNNYSVLLRIASIL